MDAPDLDHGDDEKGPPEEGDDDHRPDPDWRIVGLMSFMVSFCGVTALRYAVALVKVMQ